MKPVQVEAKTLKIYCKVRDHFTASLHDQNDMLLADYAGYVPDFMPGDHHGDYLILDVDIDTGQILNWKTPGVTEIQEFIDECKGEL